MNGAIQRLTFKVVDGFGFMSAESRPKAADNVCNYVPDRLGPLLELMHLAAGRIRLPSEVSCLVQTGGLAPLISALEKNAEFWISSSDGQMGFCRTSCTDATYDNRFTSFLMDAQRAARNVARLHGTTPGQLVAAMRELENNIREHSDAPETGLLSFRAARGIFEFVAADRGIGILNSLRSCSAYAGVTDHGLALESALTDGVSRYGGDSKRGYGFRPIFLGLVDLRGSLRFRTGDHALLIDGASPALPSARLAQKPRIDGFFVSVRCGSLPADLDGKRAAAFSE